MTGRRAALGRAALRRGRRPGRRHDLALPLRPVRLDHPLSQLYESRLLRIGSPLFHFGLLVVIVGHVIGLVVPKCWTDAAGLSQEAYHVQALLLGTIAGLSTLVGIGLLVYRRRTTGPVFSRTTRNDKLMYVVLVAAIVAGLPRPCSAPRAARNTTTGSPSPRGSGLCSCSNPTSRR